MIKNQQKGFIALPLSIILIILLIGGIFIYRNKVNKRTTSKEVSQRSSEGNNFKISTTTQNQTQDIDVVKNENLFHKVETKDVRVGDVFGSLTVKSIESFFISSKDSEKRNLTKSHIVFLGEIVLSGKVWLNETLGKYCVDVDSKDTYKIPRFKEDERSAWFCFSDGQVSLPSMLIGNATSSIFEVNDYNVNYSEKENSDTASFVRVVSDK